MKVGEYVRTDLGISKVKRVINEDKLIFYETDNELGNCHYSDEGIGYYFFKEDTNKVIIKSSPRIIDLIEVGDYVNGMLVTNIWIDKETGNIEFEFNNHESYLYPKSWNYESRVTKYKIKSIVTKEQFEAMEYKCE